MSSVITVGISEWKLANKPDRLRTSGLGSCVAVIIFDQDKGIAAMAHVMLPDHHLAKADFHPAKFADTAVPGLIDLLISKGASLTSLKAKYAGGAEMFPSFQSRLPSIGSRNATVVKETLKHHHIPKIAEDVGGNAGRTVEFNTETSALYIRTVKSGEHVI